MRHYQTVCRGQAAGFNCCVDQIRPRLCTTNALDIPSGVMAAELDRMRPVVLQDAWTETVKLSLITGILCLGRFSEP